MCLVGHIKLAEGTMELVENGGLQEIGQRLRSVWDILLGVQIVGDDDFVVDGQHTWHGIWLEVRDWLDIRQFWHLVAEVGRYLLK